MKLKQISEVWYLCYPKTGSVGVAFRRFELEKGDFILLHQAPAILGVSVCSGNRRVLLAESQYLRATTKATLTRLRRFRDYIERQEV